jgi:hypothetical protein
MELMVMMKIAASFPNPYHRIASGIQATPGIGEKIRTKGSAKVVYRRERAIPMPSGTAIATDKLNPIKTRTRLTDTWSHKISRPRHLSQRLENDLRRRQKQHRILAGDMRPK